jgi:hypothetical protein
MNAHIFTEESGTTSGDANDVSVQQYYEGGFLTVSGLADALNEYGETTVHVLSEQFGYVTGDESVDSLHSKPNEVGTTDTVREAQEALLSIAESADVVVVLLTSDAFRAMVNQQWEELVEAAKPESVWCLAAARSALKALDLERLESKGCEVLTYQRVGVARIDTETREQLLHAVDQRARRARQ